jgi:hypothetical protein
MKRLLLVLILGISIPLSSVAPSYAGGGVPFSLPWVINQLSTTPPCYHNNYAPQINDQGWVTWQGLNSSGMEEIFLFNKVSTPILPIEISTTSTNNYSPQINNNGWVTWLGLDISLQQQIYLWKPPAGPPIQISTTSTNNSSPQINDSGWVTWQGLDISLQQQIYLWKPPAGPPIQISITSTNNSSPQINNNGWVTWQGSNGSDIKIYLYDATTYPPLPPDPSIFNVPVMISTTSSNNSSPQISNNNSPLGVACVTWQAESGSQIYLYSLNKKPPFLPPFYPPYFSSLQQISDSSSFNNCYPQINDKGWVTWQGLDASYVDQIYLYKSGTHSNFSIGSSCIIYGRPQINNSGSVTWMEYDGLSTFKIQLVINGNPPITTIRSVTNFVGGPQINSSGWVTWREGWGLSPIHLTTPTEIYLYSPIFPVLVDPGNITLDR